MLKFQFSKVFLFLFYIFLILWSIDKFFFCFFIYFVCSKICLYFFFFNNLHLNKKKCYGGVWYVILRKTIETIIYQTFVRFYVCMCIIIFCEFFLVSLPSSLLPALSFTTTTKKNATFFGDAIILSVKLKYKSFIVKHKIPETKKKR